MLVATEELFNQAHSECWALGTFNVHPLEGVQAAIGVRGVKDQAGWRLRTGRLISCRQIIKTNFLKGGTYESEKAHS